MTRPDLQALARDHGVRGNLASATIIDALVEKFEEDAKARKPAKKSKPQAVAAGGVDAGVAAGGVDGGVEKQGEKPRKLQKSGGAVPQVDLRGFESDEDASDGEFRKSRRGRGDGQELQRWMQSQQDALEDVLESAQMNLRDADALSTATQRWPDRVFDPKHAREYDFLKTMGRELFFLLSSAESEYMKKKLGDLHEMCVSQATVLCVAESVGDAVAQQYVYEKGSIFELNRSKIIEAEEAGRKRKRDQEFDARKSRERGREPAVSREQDRTYVHERGRDQEQGRESGLCFTCSKPGHIARDCRAGGGDWGRGGWRNKSWASSDGRSGGGYSGSGGGFGSRWQDPPGSGGPSASPTGGGVRS